MTDDEKDIDLNDKDQIDAENSNEEEGESSDLSAAEDVELELAKMKDQLLRTMAELENLRKRTEREREDTAKYAVSGFAREMLHVSDNLRRAIEAVPEGAADEDPALKALIDGVEITEVELLNSFQKHGIKKITPQPGDEFDHNFHQAMLEIPGSDYTPGTIAQVMQPGYLIYDRLLRPALVAVAKE